jgi:hypothetical protein
MPSPPGHPSGRRTSSGEHTTLPAGSRLSLPVVSRRNAPAVSHQAPRLSALGEPPFAPGKQCWGACLVLVLCLASCGAALEPPAHLPRYHLDILLDVAGHRVCVRERVTWTNPQPLPTRKIVFNAHAHYTVPESDLPFLAKMLELLRLAPSEVFDFNGPPLEVQEVHLLPAAVPPPNAPAGGNETPPLQVVPFAYAPQNNTALEVTLPWEVHQGEQVTLELIFTLRLPQKQGRWGQWRGVTFLAQWLPVVAVYDQQGWQPTPFVPWHQPFYNEAGFYTAQITLPANEKLGCSGRIVAEQPLPDGWRRVQVDGGPLRDFALFCSARYQEHVAQVGRVRISCLALPEHSYYAQEMVRDICAALPVYERWFGPYPYSQFTIVESYFGWNGNECGGLVMIDERIFDLPHMARKYVDLLVSHEFCHQWWYNAVGTNGYAETWMDEGLAVYFSHRLMDEKYGKNNCLLEWPRGLEWLPSIRREDYRYYTLLGVVGRGEETATVQEMPGFQHLVNLSAMTYDRGGKIVGMIAYQLGDAAFYDFVRLLYRRYYFRILRVADFQRELEEYTGRSWQQFFQDWLYGKGMTDWEVEKVEIYDLSGQHRSYHGRRGFLGALRARRTAAPAPCRVVVHVRQRGDILEPTFLGISLDETEAYAIRLPLVPQAPLLTLEEPPARIESLGEGRMRVEVVLPCPPTQIAVDPDQVLLDRNPSNNYWKPQVRKRFTPFYFELDETDLTNSYDRLNFIFGPWFYGATYQDPWYTRSPMLGLRAGVYRTQEYAGGAYLALRSDDRNLVAGVDGLIDHWPWPHTQVGFNIEKSLATLSEENISYSRGVIYGRYIFNYSTSLYLPPIDYVEVYAAAQNRGLPLPRYPTPGADLFTTQNLLGVHYHLDYLTPYWDPEGGFALDVTYQEGLPVFGEQQELHQVWGQFSTVLTLPRSLEDWSQVPGVRWLLACKLAARLYGGAAFPNNAEVFTLGGGDHFRGFDLSERQGNQVWLASVEWRFPLVRDVHWDCADHIVGLRHIYGATFYDVGNAYLNGRSQGPIAQAVGAGLRLDLAWFSFIERTILRFDVAKALDSRAPVQFWFGVRHPF